MPEVIIGIPMYDYRDCTAYVIEKLRENKFVVRYTHPNLLFISWKHWVPSYVRNEIKKKTGIVVNEYGEKIVDKDDQDNDSDEDYEQDNDSKQNNQNLQQIKNSKKYTPINSYKPSGKLVYSEDLLNKIENKFS